MDRKATSRLVSGPLLIWVKLRALLSLVRISMRTFPRSRKAFYALKFLLTQRRRLHGHRRDRKIVRSGHHYYWSIYTPAFPSPLFRKVMQREITRALEPERSNIPLQTLILSISSRCHYQCEHCYEGHNLARFEHLPIADLAGVIRQAMELGIPHIQIGGGEPMLRFKDLIRLLELGKDHMEFWLSTSGYGLSREKAWDLKIAGLTGATISMDHWKAWKHNEFRKHPEAFHWAQEAVENCKNAGIIPNLTLCVTHSMAHEANLMRYMQMAKNMGVPFVRFLEARPSGNYADKDVLLRKKEQEELIAFYQKLNSSFRYRSYPIIQYPGYHQRKLGCFGAGNRYIFIDSHGNYHSCPFCRTGVGNIKDMPLKEAIQRLQQAGCQLFQTNAYV